MDSNNNSFQSTTPSAPPDGSTSSFAVNDGGGMSGNMQNNNQPGQQPHGSTMLTNNQFADGGETAGKKNVLSRFFEDITVSDVVITTLAMVALVAPIIYWRKIYKEQNEVLPEITEEISDVKQDLKTLKENLGVEA